jgi:sulfatase maturation enzyme AslB (radical SAM superfamily)
MPIKRFVECLLPVTACNLKCSYCYVIQRNNRKMKQAELKYTPEQIDRAMAQSRWGGGNVLLNLRCRRNNFTE